MVLASMIAEPDKVTGEQMDRWADKFHSWDLCDQCCNDLFHLMPQAWNKCREWCEREEEFVRRAGFALLASLAVHDRTAQDGDFVKMLAVVERHSPDGRNYVKKAVSWALRQIGKRNLVLNDEAVRTAERIAARKDPSSRWVASDALRELRGEAVRERLMNRGR